MGAPVSVCNLFTKKHVRWEFPGGLVVKGSSVVTAVAQSLLWHRFDPWPRNSGMPWVQLKKKKKKVLELSYVPKTILGLGKRAENKAVSYVADGKEFS